MGSSNDGMSGTARSRRFFVKSAGVMGVGAFAAFAGACAGQHSQAAPASSAGAQAAMGSSSGEAASSNASAGALSGTASMAKSAVVFFSRAGENYEVGYVEEGNTAIVAHMIAGKIVSDVFEIVPLEAYPEGYDECRAQAEQERSLHARPGFEDSFAELDQFDTVYLGYPIWWEDLPMVVYSFLESRNWTGKTIAPFCTYGDSGLGSTVESMRRTCPQATVLDGLEIKGSVAQNDGFSADRAINEWLAHVRS